MDCYSVSLTCSQDITRLLIGAARRNDHSLFEYLVEHGARIPFNVLLLDNSIADMLQRRQDWINQVVAIAHRWHAPLTAMRVIHEYVVGYNWAVVVEAFE